MLQLQQLEQGQALPAYTKEAVSKVQLVKYAGASGDYNPLHTDDAFAQKIGLSGVVAHGMLIMGFLGEYVNHLAGSVAFVEDFSMRFGAMTFANETITCGGVVQDLYEQHGKQYAVLQLTAQKSPQEIVGTGQAILQF